MNKIELLKSYIISNIKEKGLYLIIENYYYKIYKYFIFNEYINHQIVFGYKNFLNFLILNNYKFKLTEKFFNEKYYIFTLDEWCLIFNLKINFSKKFILNNKHRLNLCVQNFYKYQNFIILNNFIIKYQKYIDWYIIYHDVVVGNYKLNILPNKINWDYIKNNNILSEPHIKIIIKLIQ